MIAELKVRFLVDVPASVFSQWLKGFLETDDFTLEEDGVKVALGASVAPPPKPQSYHAPAATNPNEVWLNYERGEWDEEIGDFLSSGETQECAYVFTTIPVRGNRTEVIAASRLTRYSGVVTYFHHMLRSLEERWPKARDGIAEQVEPRPAPVLEAIDAGLLPKTKKAFKRWRDSWRKIARTRSEYRRLYFRGDTESPNPTMDELRDALSPIWGRKPCEKSVSRVMRAGELKLLDE